MKKHYFTYGDAVMTCVLEKKGKIFAKGVAIYTPMRDENGNPTDEFDPLTGMIIALKRAKRALRKNGSQRIQYFTNKEALEIYYKATGRPNTVRVHKAIAPNELDAPFILSMGEIEEIYGKDDNKKDDSVFQEYDCSQQPPADD